MKRGNSIYANLIFFVAGSIITYITLQFSYFNINADLNVVETLLSIITALIGLYIAISIQKKNNRSQSLHTFLQSKMDNIWTTFTGFDNQLNNQSTIQLNLVTKSTKSFYKELNNIKVIFKSFNLNSSCIDDLESSFDTLENFIANNLPINQNVIQLSNNRKDIKNHSNLVHEKIVNTLVDINKIL